MLPIRIRLVEHRQQASLNVLLCRLSRILILRAPPLLHWVHKVRSLLISEIRKSSDVEGSHHVMILMDEVVAMEHVHPIPGRILGQNLHLLVDAEKHDIFECDLLVLEDRALPVETFNDLEVDEVDVNWMGPAAAAILELPQLHLTARRPCQDPVIYVGEGDAIDRPFAVAAAYQRSL